MKNKNTDSVKKTNDVESSWYYFYSVGCTFCTKLEPIIDELNEDGHDILKLDLSNVNNKKLKSELEKEYNTTPEKPQCGTPWLINAETGNQICGYRDKDTVLKWLDGEDIPSPPKPTRPVPRLPFNKAKKSEEKKWKKEYKEWLKENKHIPNLSTADDMLNRPRPNSNPPMFPNLHSTEDQLQKFKSDYEQWYKENSHMPNLNTAEVIVNRIKQAQLRAGTNKFNQSSDDLQSKVTILEDKIDRLMSHLGVK